MLDDVLDDASFFTKYPELSSDSALVMVVFNDYLQRKFANREGMRHELKFEEVADVEQCIIDSKVSNYVIRH